MNADGGVTHASADKNLCFICVHLWLKNPVDARLLIDSGVLLLYFAVIISIGLTMGRKEDNLEDFAHIFRRARRRLFPA
jgi:hypothetical protein